MSLNCKYLDVCRGCPLGACEHDQQKIYKKQKLVQHLEAHLSASALKNTNYDFVFPISDRYRTRCDFIFQNNQLGWYTADRQFLAIDECVLHTPELTQFAQSIAQMKWPIAKGSMRFRISPDGTRGLWLDLANLDIKNILSSASFLPALIEQGVLVEMGQKGKRVILKDPLKMSDPYPFPWFTSLYNNQPTPLKTLISSFTQTSPDLNIQLIRIIKKHLEGVQFDQIIEFGSGTGNFTLMLSELSSDVLAIENDPRNLIPLRTNIDDLKLNDKVSVVENVHSYLKQDIEKAGQRMYFVNPSRSGVGALFDSSILATDVVYISCHLESFIRDVTKLDRQGFSLVQATLFDQFPHSEHFEIISIFRKVK